uniref:Uncharacterized protein n=1 Tax=Laticauda laticaudata TaxID=8630 RepID=A0A8C5STA3_LATLA
MSCLTSQDRSVLAEKHTHTHTQIHTQRERINTTLVRFSFTLYKEYIPLYLFHPYIFSSFLVLLFLSSSASTLTQDANQRGDIASAKRYSRLALILDHTALGLGIALVVLTIIILVIFFTSAAHVILNDFCS